MSEKIKLLIPRTLVGAGLITLLALICNMLGTRIDLAGVFAGALLTSILYEAFTPVRQDASTSDVYFMYVSNMHPVLGIFVRVALTSVAILIAISFLRLLGFQMNLISAWGAGFLMNFLFEKTLHKKGWI